MLGRRLEFVAKLTYANLRITRRLLGTKNNEIEKVTVLGGGVMGSGIAELAARNGFQVTVVDTDEYNQKCMVSVIKSLNALARNKFPDEKKTANKYITDVLKNIYTERRLEAGCADADIVIESVIENHGVKSELLQRVDATAPRHCIVTSNTSSIKLADLSKSLAGRADKFAGLHFLNPASKMRLVEVGRTPQTSDATVATLSKFVGDLGKEMVSCADTSGFVVNRLLMPYLLDALRLLEQDIATINDIDTAMKLGTGMPLGPFELIDNIGVDDVKRIIDGWHAKEPDNPMYQPSPILDELVAQKKLGRKTLKGFYSYKHSMYHSP